jgi:ring-1,2-phenylacetyl-CoA epoxidase subunit PaaE
MNGYIPLKIVSVKTETDDCKTFVLEPADGSKLTCQAGQFLTLVFPKGAGEDRRSFSISSTPILDEPLSITVKKIANGEYSRKLVDYARVGDILQTIGASGFFTEPDNIESFRQLVFIAAGSGITPIYSLIKTVLVKYPEIRVLLIYGNRTKANTIFHKELEALAIQYKERFIIEWLFSTALNLEKARLSKWLLEKMLQKYMVLPAVANLFYLCGPYEFMRMAGIELLEDGIPAANIRKEIFNPFKPVIKQLPPDTDAHMVTITTGEKNYSLKVQYPQTILQAIKKAGIAVRYSCEAGKCGTCVAHCSSGVVWMSSNEVLMEDEIAKGKVLTCVGYPVNGDVVLEL